MNDILLKACATFAIGCSPLLAQQWYAPKPGQIHPDFSLRRVDNGESVSLTDYRGKKVILIHFASW